VSNRGNPKIALRVPEDHWILKIEDNKLRNDIIREALDLYAHYEKLENKLTCIEETLENLSQSIEKINEKGVAVKEDSEQNDKVDQRLVNSADGFLDF